MAQLSRPHLFDKTLIESIRPPLWRELLTMTAELLLSKQSVCSHQAIAKMLPEVNLPEPLREALQVVRDLGTEPGVELIEAAVEDQGADTAGWPTNETYQETALRTWLLAQSEPVFQRVLARAYAALRLTIGPRNFREYAGRLPRNLDDPYRARDQIREELLGWCRANGRGDHVEVEVYPTVGHQTTFHVIINDKDKTDLVAADARRRELRLRRPVHGDHIYYDATSGRLSVATSDRGLPRVYPRVCGEALFADPDFFASEDICTLEPLRGGAEVLEDHHISDIARVVLVACTWKRGRKEKVVLTAADCFDRLSEYSVPFATEGELVEAKLDVHFFGSSTRPVRVTIKVPNRIDFLRDARETAIHGYLDGLGVRRTAPDRRRRDLWSLHPWSAPLTTWRAAYAERTDAQCTAGVLRPTRHRAGSSQPASDLGHCPSLHPPRG